MRPTIDVHGWGAGRRIEGVETHSRRLLGVIAQINGRYLDVLAMRPATAAEADDPAFTALHGLEADARQRLARIPVLLVDLRFQDIEWWRSLSRRAGRESCAGEAVSRDAITIDLARHVLMVAWHMAGSAAPMFLLGIPEPVSRIIADLELHEIDRVAVECHAQLGPRWAGCAEVWRTILEAARDTGEARAHELQLHGLRLLQRELLGGRQQCPASGELRAST